MNHEEDGLQLDPLPGEDETDPNYPAAFGQRGPASAKGSLNVPGAPRIDRTNPNFLVSESPVVSKPKDVFKPKEAVTQDVPPVSAAQRELDDGLSVAMEPDQSGFRQRVRDEEARRGVVSNESIDELIDGLPFESALPRKKSARRKREEASLPARPKLPSLTAQQPLTTGSDDLASAIRDGAVKPSLSGSLVPAGLTRTRRPLMGGLVLLAVLLVAAFFVARSTQTPAPAVEQVQAVQAPPVAVPPAIEAVPAPAVEEPAVPAEPEPSAEPVASAERARSAKKETHPSGLETDLREDEAPRAKRSAPAAKAPSASPPPVTPPPATDLLTGH